MSRLHKKYERYARIVHTSSSVIVVLVGFAALVGWWARIESLKSVVPGLATMKANTAALFVCTGLSLWAVGKRESPRHRWAGIGLAIVVLGGSLLTLAEYAFDSDFGIDQLLARDAESRVFPGRMAVVTATLFTLIGTGLIGLHARARQLSQVAAIAALQVSFLCCLSYLYGGNALLAVGSFASVALHTAVAFLIASIGMLAARPDHVLVRLLLSSGTSGVLVRRLFPVAVAIPALVGLLRLKGEQAGWYGLEFGLALFALSNIALFVALVFWAGSRVETADVDRRLVTDALRASETRFRLVVEVAPYGMLLVDRDGRIVIANAAIEPTFGYPRHELIGLPVEQLLPDRDRDRHHMFRSAFFEAPEGRAMGLGRELHGLRKDRTEFPVEVGLQPVEIDGAVFVLASVVDITPRKQAEAELRESQQRFRLLLEGVPQLVWTCRPDGTCDYLSRQWVEYTGVPEVEQLGYGWLEAIHPDDRSVLAERWEEAVQKGEWFNQEFRIRSASGAYRWFHTRAVRYQMADGTAKWLGTNTDIDDRKRAEDSLRELNHTLESRVMERSKEIEAQQSLLDAVLDALPVAVIIADPTGQITRMNRACERVWGVASTSDGRQEAEEWIGYWADSGRKIEKHEWALSRVLATGQGCADELIECERFGDRSRRSVLNSAAAAVGPDGQIVAGVVASVDVTDRIAAERALRQSEERYRAVVEDGTEIVCRFKSDNTILFVNGVYCRTFGKTESELVGTNWAPAVHPDDLPAITSGLARMTVTNPIVLIENRVIDAEGRVRWMEFVNRGFFDSNGALLEIQAVARDVTERKQAESDLQEALSEVRRSNADLEQFAYVASHDLQEPLRAVAGCVQILRKRYAGHLDPSANELIDHAVSGAKRMQSLIHDLLDYSRVATRKVELRKTDSGAALKQALNALTGAVEEAGATITNDPLPIVESNDTQLTQLFQNLIGNAIKYRSDSPPVIHVSAKWVGEWEFSVRDNGIGIAPEYFERVFAIFQRLHTRAEYPGTGIGLAICKKIIERHGGRIWLESEPGAGTTFFFTIPGGKVGP